MKNFEHNYVKLINKVLDKGESREGRNGGTLSLFGETYSFDMSDDQHFPLLVGRKMHYKGVFGELAAFLRGPKSLADFEKFGCNYWKLWAKSDGSINVDYGNLWTDWNGYNQLEVLLDTLKTNPNDRRMIISSWKPDTLNELDLPCCHYSYQWYVREGGYLDMIWTQRSCDVMIGLPSDIILAATLNVLIANAVGLKPGKIKMDLGDTHIYTEHLTNVETYLSRVPRGIEYVYPKYFCLKSNNPQAFLPTDIVINNYQPLSAINFEVIA